MARSYDWQRIRIHRPYTLETFAALFYVHPATVRRWIKFDGLDVAIVSHHRPMILNAKAAREWMRKRESDRKQPCGPNDMYCVACKAPRNVQPNTVRIVTPKPPKIIVKGDCIVCNLTLRRFDTEANRAALEARFDISPPDSV